MNLQLDGKIALVTGSTAGIGLAIASELAQEGARVIVNGRTEKRVHEAIKQIHAAHPKAKVEGFIADFSEVAAVERVAQKFPHVDVLVNNLGVYEPKAFEAITDTDWNKIIETNFLSGVRLSRVYLPKMKGQNWGRIIFISSESAANIPIEMIHYGVTKTMQVALARGLAETTVGTAVTVNSILVGPTKSEGVDTFVGDLAKSKGTTAAEVEKEFFSVHRTSSLIHRFATTEEVAHMVAYVASPLSSATNGAAIRVEGGLLRSIL